MMVPGKNKSEFQCTNERIHRTMTDLIPVGNGLSEMPNVEPRTDDCGTSWSNPGARESTLTKTDVKGS